MTQPPPQPTPPPLPSPSVNEPVVNPTPESRLDRLAAEYALVKPQADAQKERLQELTDSIKAELAMLLPEGSTSILLTSPHLLAPLRMRHRPGTWSIDSRALKAALPEESWKPWAKQSRATWELRAVD